jgi:hypothetical protein
MKKMFDMFSHQGNANQSSLRFELTPVRMAVIKKINSKMDRVRKLYTLLVKI